MSGTLGKNLRIHTENPSTYNECSRIGWSEFCPWMPQLELLWVRLWLWHLEALFCFANLPLKRVTKDLPVLPQVLKQFLVVGNVLVSLGWSLEQHCGELDAYILFSISLRTLHLPFFFFCNGKGMQHCTSFGGGGFFNTVIFFRHSEGNTTALFLHHTSLRAPVMG